VTREQFEHLTADILYRTESRLGRVLKQAKLSWEKIDQVLVVGGSTRMPQVLEMLKRVTGKDPNCSLSPDEAVAHGAAIHAAVCGLDAPTKASPDYGFGIATDGSSEPTEASVPGLLSYFKNKVVSLLLSIRTSNVNAHSLGVVVNLADRSERVSVLIPHDTQLPVSVTKRFGTNSDNQKSVTVRIIEGESSKPAECLLVGTCQIQQLPPGLPKGSPIDITFTYDNSCRLHVKARDAASGCWAAAIIQRTSGLPVGGSALARLEEATQTPVS
jgi:molecular chaperone DnaK